MNDYSHPQCIHSLDISRSRNVRALIKAYKVKS